MSAVPFVNTLVLLIHDLYLQHSAQLPSSALHCAEFVTAEGQGPPSSFLCLLPQRSHERGLSQSLQVGGKPLAANSSVPQWYWLCGQDRGIWKFWSNIFS